MSVPVSTVPSVKAYLYAGLKARTELAEPVLVCYDDPGPNEPDDIISIGDVHREVSIMQMVGSGGAGWLDENYTIDVFVDCFRGDDNPQLVFERAAALADVVIDFVRLDPQLGNPSHVIKAYPSMTAQESVWDETHMGRGSCVVITIAVHARI